MLDSRLSRMAGQSGSEDGSMRLNRTLVAAFVLFFVFRHRYGIDAGKPAVEIDIGAAARAKRS